MTLMKYHDNIIKKAFENTSTYKRKKNKNKKKRKKMKKKDTNNNETVYSLDPSLS